MDNSNLIRNTINWDAYRVAADEIRKNVDIPKYFNDNISDKINLMAQTLVCCPLHDETTPSFKYFSDTETFYCFGCERGGTVVELHHYLGQRNIDNYTKVKALLDISKDYDIKIPNIFDERYTDKSKLFKHRNVRINKDKKYPIPWILNEIEKKLEIIKREDLVRYINLCNSVDKIYLVGDDSREKLLNILERL